MRVPRFRFTIRRMMVAVAVVCLPLTIAPLILWDRTRSIRYARASAHNYEARLIYLVNGNPDQYHQKFSVESVSKTDREFLDAQVRKYHYHLRMEQKWLKAAHYPRLPVEPDPPDPE